MKFENNTLPKLRELYMGLLNPEATFDSFQKTMKAVNEILFHLNGWGGRSTTIFIALSLKKKMDYSQHGKAQIAESWEIEICQKERI